MRAFSVLGLICLVVIGVSLSAAALVVATLTDFVSRSESESS